jgi:adenine-specific DNA-methyltransferase
VAVFSRESVKYILNAAGVRNLTCFHGLYCREKNEGVLALMTLFLNSSLGREAFFAVNRFYGDGLNKLEPKDVEAMPCPVMPVITKNRVQDLFDKLVQMESLSPEAKQAEADSLVAEVFDLRPEEVEEAWSSR